MPLVVNEIFYSIQGESLYAGLPCVFVRLTGCNLRCTYCDTRYAYEQGTAMEMPQILERVEPFHCKLVEITGGEPLCQAETPHLARTLIKLGYTVLLETNGTYDISGLDRRCIKIVDVKCPSSGESRKNKPDTLNQLHPTDQVKFVIADRKDYLFARKTAKRIPRNIPPGHILFSPVHGRLSAHVLAQWILEDNLKVRLHFQLHKIIWPDVDRGV